MARGFISQIPFISEGLQIAESINRRIQANEQLPITIFGEEFYSFVSLHVDGDVEDQLIFQINPTTYENRKSVNYKFQDIPHLSDPLGQFISGGLETIRFPFKLSSLFKSQCPVPNSSDPTGRNIATNVVQDTIDWIESKMVPDVVDNALQAAPPVLILSWGDKIQRVRIKDFVYKPVRFDNALVVREADCELMMFTAINRHRQPRDFLQSF